MTPAEKAIDRIRRAVSQKLRLLGEEHAARKLDEIQIRQEDRFTCVLIAVRTIEPSLVAGWATRSGDPQWAAAVEAVALLRAAVWTALASRVAAGWLAALERRVRESPGASAIVPDRAE